MLTTELYTGTCTINGLQKFYNWTSRELNTLNCPPAHTTARDCKLSTAYFKGRHKHEPWLPGSASLLVMSVMMSVTLCRPGRLDTCLQNTVKNPSKVSLVSRSKRAFLNPALCRAGLLQGQQSLVLFHSMLKSHLPRSTKTGNSGIIKPELLALHF